MSNAVIFAPHIDDEVIGCFSLLSKKQISEVYYFDEWDEPSRALEAHKCAEHFGFTPVFTYRSSPPTLDHNTLIYLPHIRDTHPIHKEVNLIGKLVYPNNPKKYYSVDMNITPKLLDDLSEKKRRALFHLFPSQHEYFQTHAQSYLFENIFDSDIETTITVRTSFIGFHCYPHAPEAVAFLRNVHRHRFEVEVTLSVTHDDRDVEFFMLQKELDQHIQDQNNDYQHRSCEMIAKQLLHYLMSHYKGRDLYKVSVSEDGENGSTAEFKVR